MSAFIVCKEHIDLLIRAALHYARESNLVAPTDHSVADRGRMLWNENFKSVVYRYPDSEPEETGRRQPPTTGDASHIGRTPGKDYENGKATLGN